MQCAWLIDAISVPPLVKFVFHRERPPSAANLQLSLYHRIFFKKMQFLPKSCTISSCCVFVRPPAAVPVPQRSGSAAPVNKTTLNRYFFMFWPCGAAAERAGGGNFFLQVHQKQRLYLWIVHTVRAAPDRPGYPFTAVRFPPVPAACPQKNTPARAGRRRCGESGCYCGRRTVKQVASGVLAAVMAPPCRWTISRAMARPSPAPPPRLWRAESRR